MIRGARVVFFLAVFGVLLLSGLGCEGAGEIIGPQGLPGELGLPGQTGANGADGANGAEATNGTDGINGTNGVDGNTGANGAQGNPGRCDTVKDGLIDLTVTFLDSEEQELTLVDKLGDIPPQITKESTYYLIDKIAPSAQYKIRIEPVNPASSIADLTFSISGSCILSPAGPNGVFDMTCGDALANFTNDVRVEKEGCNLYLMSFAFQVKSPKGGLIDYESMNAVPVAISVKPFLRPETEETIGIVDSLVLEAGKENVTATFLSATPLSRDPNRETIYQVADPAKEKVEDTDLAFLEVGAGGGGAAPSLKLLTVARVLFANPDSALDLIKLRHFNLLLAEGRYSLSAGSTLTFDTKVKEYVKSLGITGWNTVKLLKSETLDIQYLVMVGDQSSKSILHVIVLYFDQATSSFKIFTNGPYKEAQQISYYDTTYYYNVTFSLFNFETDYPAFYYLKTRKDLTAGGTWGIHWEGAGWKNLEFQKVGDSLFFNVVADPNAPQTELLIQSSEKENTLLVGVVDRSVPAAVVASYRTLKGFEVQMASGVKIDTAIAGLLFADQQGTPFYLLPVNYPNLREFITDKNKEDIKNDEVGIRALSDTAPVYWIRNDFQVAYSARAAYINFWGLNAFSGIVQNYSFSTELNTLIYDNSFALLTYWTTY